MCGIFGLTSTTTNLFVKELLLGSELIRPRGPERSHHIQTNQMFLSFHRLAINGLSSQKDQPYTYQWNDKTVYLLCNGEIYNAPELYYQVTNQHFVKGMSDVEVIYHVWKYVDYDFKKLNQKLLGEYALAIVTVSADETIDTIYLSTDYVSVRPLFFYVDETYVGFSSLLKGLSILSFLDHTKIQRLPGNHQVIIDCKSYNSMKIEKYSEDPVCLYTRNQEEIQRNIVDTLNQSVKDRLLSDRKIGCLLSGGLDSSLTSALIAKYAKQQNIKIHTFAIGLEGSPDCKYAKIVADHIGSEHTEIIITEEQALSVIPEVVRILESFDITTIRASVWQYLLAQYISQHHPDIKVIIAGEGSDELLGYVYLKAAPNEEEFQRETEKLLHEIHLFDGIRADRCISHFGLEARFPFLDERFVRLILSIEPKYKMHTEEHCEKWILRESFRQLETELLPHNVLFRPKAAMSDACSKIERSWFQIVQEYIEKKSDLEKQLLFPVNWCIPISVESTYFRRKWQEHFPESCSHVIPHFWLPNQKWLPNTTDPSARTLNFYHGEKE